MDWTRAEIIQLVQVAGIILVAIIGLIGVKIGRGTHISINSRMDQLLEASKKGARAEGVEEGRAENRK